MYVRVCMRIITSILLMLMPEVNPAHNSYVKRDVSCHFISFITQQQATRKKQQHNKTKQAVRVEGEICALTRVERAKQYSWQLLNESCELCCQAYGGTLAHTLTHTHRHVHAT
ncbi:unnamed protein product [Ceratitis capitata]|uniref:(Mediterranean fruit fly) hypothetical protein n=1 Tax=Ceratitis capitata TaxID=7213 RepID=A0A811V2I1_CERCA|nr:unnamed protein product [Ceratitis capitata]